MWDRAAGCRREHRYLIGWMKWIGRAEFLLLIDIFIDMCSLTWRPVSIYFLEYAKELVCVEAYGQEPSWAGPVQLNTNPFSLTPVSKTTG
jgi:hypothetical protein